MYVCIYFASISRKHRAMSWPPQIRRGCSQIRSHDTGGLDLDWIVYGVDFLREHALARNERTPHMCERTNERTRCAALVRIHFIVIIN